MCGGVYVCVWLQMLSGHQIFLELELKAMGVHLTWMLGTVLKSSGRVVVTLQTISPALKLSLKQPGCWCHSCGCVYCHRVLLTSLFMLFLPEQSTLPSWDLRCSTWSFNKPVYSSPDKTVLLGETKQRQQTNKQKLTPNLKVSAWKCKISDFLLLSPI